MDEIYQAPLLKRVLASVLDGTITVLLAIGLFMLLINGAVDIGFHNLGLKIEQYQLQETSSLFNVKKDDSSNYQEISLWSFDKDKADEHARFAKILHEYYFSMADDENKSEAAFNQKYMGFAENSLVNAIYSISSIDDNYLTYTLLDEVANVSTGKKAKKEEGTAYYEAISNFYMDENKGVYNFAVTQFTNSKAFQEISLRLESIERLEALICTAVAAFVFLSIPVLINKNGETPFMHVLSICFATSYGYQVKWSNKIIRSIVSTLLWASSIYLYGLPLLANIIVCLATSQKRSIIDLASNETAIDKKTSIILAE